MSESCDDYCTVHRREIRRARKEHRCVACSATIRAGDYYAFVFTLFEREAQVFKRCGACERTWQHLKRLCDEHNRKHRLYGENLYPMEDLGCGKQYSEEWGDLPDDIAALPFLSADERGGLLKP